MNALVLGESLGMVFAYIDGLVGYGIRQGLIGSADAIFMRNQVLDALGLDSYKQTEEAAPSGDLQAILGRLADFACARGIAADTEGGRDLFKTRLMGLLTPLPSAVTEEFNEQRRTSARQATDYFFQLCAATDYVRKNDANIKWVTPSEYGDIDITINLSKPEKDPRDIAAASKAEKGDYPRCLLCVENEGYAGQADHPARQNLRIVPVDVAGEAWGLQYSPYQYYDEHCIILNRNHIPMVIDHAVFTKLFSFVEQFPHYFAGSNADLPIVGGSILSHEHFQGGRYEFAMAKAGLDRRFELEGYGDVEAGVLKWPMSVIRLAQHDWRRLAGAAGKVLDVWRAYTDESVQVFSHTGDTPHNTITPIARARGGRYELDLVLRNNITTNEHPMGLFHPHAELHNIKKENIGLIEVLGLAILPGRLQQEMQLLSECIAGGHDIMARPETAKHASWWETRKSSYATIQPEQAEGILRREIGMTFLEILHQCAVFKRDDIGKRAFERFLEQI